MSILQGGVVSTSPNPQAGGPPLVGYCLFNLFAATLHIAGRSSIRNLRARHAVVTVTFTQCTQFSTQLHTTTANTTSAEHHMQ